MNFDYNGIFGFDVSFYQDNDNTPQKIDFFKMKEYGASFVIVKAGQLNYYDEDFRDYWADAKQAGIPRSSYWFCDRRDSGRAQAEKYWEGIKFDVGEGMLFADYETGSWTDWNELYSFLYELQRRSGLPSHRIGIYTGYYYWNAHRPTNAASLNWFRQFPLWLAWYSENPGTVSVPTPWTECLIWQDGTPAIGIEAGVESMEIDHNRFNGDADKFEFFMGGTPSTPPPPEGDNMYNCKVVTTATFVNLRQTPAGLDIGDVPNGTVFLADRIEKDAQGKDWLHSVTPGMVGYIAAWLATYELIEQPVEDKPVEITIKMSSGKVYTTTEITEV